jgi:hypothetical protein
MLLLLPHKRQLLLLLPRQPLLLELLLRRLACKPHVGSRPWCTHNRPLGLQLLLLLLLRKLLLCIWRQGLPRLRRELLLLLLHVLQLLLRERLLCAYSLLRW